jgi:hypothetical protein
LYFNKIIATSNNKTRATWKVIRNAIGNDHVPTNTTCLKITGKNIRNYQDIVNSFNNFLLDVANITKEGINKDIVIDRSSFLLGNCSFDILLSIVKISNEQLPNRKEL